MRQEQNSSVPQPPPILPLTTSPVVIDGVQGILAFQIGPFGVPSIEFTASGDMPGATWMSQRRVRNLTVGLEDGRRLTLRKCAVVSRRHSFSREHGARFTARFLPLALSLGTPGGRAQITEFGFANLDLIQPEGLRFDGYDFAFAWADRGLYRYPEDPQGQRSPLTHRGSTATRSRGDVERALSAAWRLCETVAMLTHERAAVPCYRVLDAHGRVVEFRFDHVLWPTLMKHHLIYTTDWKAALETVGSNNLDKPFKDYQLTRYVNYVLEARECRYEELKLACLLMALECVTGHWALANGYTHGQLKSMSLSQKLGKLNKTPRFIDAKYTDGKLASAVRNQLFHMGVVPLAPFARIVETVDELFLLATHVFFRLLGCIAPEYQGRKG